MDTIKVKDIMTPHPFMMHPSQTVQEAAQRMKEIDCGVLPVGSSGNVVGIITDRDITIRITAEAIDPRQKLVEEVMTRRVYTCDEEDDIEIAAEEMHKHDIARLVVTRGKEFTGIVTMAELLRAKGDLHKGEQVLHRLVGRQKAS